MDARSEIVEDLKAGEMSFDFEAIFHSQYRNIAGVIARVVRDRGRAEALAAEVFVKLWRTPMLPPLWGGNPIHSRQYRPSLFG